MARWIIYSALAAWFCVSAWTNPDGGPNTVANYIWVVSRSDQPPEVDILERDRWERMRYRVWLDLCLDYRTEVSCGNIRPPQIKIFQPSPFRPGLMGFYAGGDTIYLKRGLTITQREEVYAHEASHYLDASLGMTNVPGTAEEVCFSEKRAWAVTDMFWTRKGTSNIIGEKWVDWYKHCQPYRDKLYPK